LHNDTSLIENINENNQTITDSCLKTDTLTSRSQLVRNNNLNIQKTSLKSFPSQYYENYDSLSESEDEDMEQKQVDYNSQIAHSSVIESLSEDLFSYVSENKKIHNPSNTLQLEDDIQSSGCQVLPNTGNEKITDPKKNKCHLKRV
jgi:hypothetical protein